MRVVGVGCSKVHTCWLQESSTALMQTGGQAAEQGNALCVSACAPCWVAHTYVLLTLTMRPPLVMRGHASASQTALVPPKLVASVVWASSGPNVLPL